MLNNDDLKEYKEYILIGSSFLGCSLKCEVTAKTGRNNEKETKHTFNYPTNNNSNLYKFEYANTSKIKIEYTEDEIDTFFDWISGIGSYECIINPEEKYYDYLNQLNNKNNYQLIGITNFYDFLLLN